MDMVTIPAGHYRVFPVEGELPRALVSTWKNIWQAYSTGDSAENRAYTCDFEVFETGPSGKLARAVVYLSVR
jgi:predicted transcriptional regulator YdeE